MREVAESVVSICSAPVAAKCRLVDRVIITGSGPQAEPKDGHKDESFLQVGGPHGPLCDRLGLHEPYGGSLVSFPSIMPVRFLTELSLVALRWSHLWDPSAGRPRIGSRHLAWGCCLAAWKNWELMRQVRQFLEHEKDQKLADNAAERASCHVTAACTSLSHFKWLGYWTAVE